MSELEYLYVFAEMSAILIGFTTIVMAFSSGDDNSDFSSYTLSNVIQRGLATAVFATLPGLLVHIGQLAEYVWELSSLAIFVFGFFITVRSYLWFQSLDVEDLPFAPSRYYSLAGLGVLFTLVSGLNTLLGIPWIYMVHVTYTFVSTGLLVITYMNSLKRDA